MTQALPTTSSVPAKSQVCVGLSGGVDSAVAAAVLCQQGHHVTGLFMKNWDEDDGSEYCTAKEDLADAQRVADHLGIELVTANFAAEYWDNVFESFLAGYQRGETPNPDVLCNREIKFKQFSRYARSLGADYVATGHYARAAVAGDGPALMRAADASKDQTYFLLGVNRDELASVIFPLGDLQKTEVRAQAKSLGLHNFDRKDSTGICFIGERRFRDFLARYLPAKNGVIVDTAGRTRGEHMGAAYYTIGQREGLGIGGQRGSENAPWFVIGKNVAANELIVSQDSGLLMQDYLVTTHLNWLADEPPLPSRVYASTRYRQRATPATLTLRADGALRVRFDSPQRAITPGQYLCLYDEATNTRCLGGGVIRSFGRHAH
ncbi:MAG: tRNA 2-thiouridine(34) synthase MnmA [Pseudomonadaceae bacterium]|nr:tRNA 2-thiouridine(34) synthase MnmA [Pseudomonadaceae bacterium]